MQSLFSIANSSGSQGTVRSMDWKYIHDGLKRNLKTTIEFYQSHSMAVRPEHLLVRLLHNIAVPQSLNIERYFENVDALALDLATALGLTSAIYPGKIFDGVFYGEDSKEIIIAHNDYFDFRKAEFEWENLRPVQVLRHFRSDLYPNLPNGKKSGVESGLAVISINIPMLAIQYRSFRMQEIINTTNEEGVQYDTQKSTMQFIHMYVLPNMLYSHMDLAIFNRLYNLEFGIPLGESIVKHSFFISDYTEKMDDFLSTILKTLQTSTRTFKNILENIPLISEDSALELMSLPDIAPTRQVMWAIVISRLNELMLLFRLAKEAGGNKNQSEINRVMRHMQMYRSDRLFKSILPRDLYMDVIEQIAQLNEMSR